MLISTTHVWQQPSPFGDLPVTIHDLLAEYINKPFFSDDNHHTYHETNNKTLTPQQPMPSPMQIDSGFMTKYAGCTPAYEPLLEEPEPDHGREGAQAFLDWLDEVAKECPPAPRKLRRSARLAERMVPIPKFEYDSPTDSEDDDSSSDYEQRGIQTLMKWKEENKEKMTSRVQCEVCGRVFAYRRKTLHERTKSHRKAMLTAFDA